MGRPLLMENDLFYSRLCILIRVAEATLAEQSFAVGALFGE